MKTNIMKMWMALVAVTAILFSGCGDKNGATTQPANPTKAASSPASSAGSQSITNTVKKITLATFSKALGNAPYLVAKYNKWFEGDPALAGMTFEYKVFEDRAMISSAFTANELQVLFSAEIPAIIIRAQGNDVRIVGVSGNAAQEILVPSTSPVNSIEGLKGQTVVVLASTSSHYGLLKILNAHGLKENQDVTIEYMQPPIARVAFEQGKIAAWAVWAPWVEQQQFTGKGKTLPKDVALIHSVMTFSAAFIRDNEPQALAVYRVLQRAKRSLIENPDAAEAIIASELGYKPEEVKLAWPKFNWAAQLDDPTIADIQEKATFLAKEDKTRNSKELDVRKELIDLRFKDAK
jgi:sulfonate transport system substrate-binding protein